MTAEQWIALIGVLSPVLLALLGGLGWVIKRAITGPTEKPAADPTPLAPAVITQGQPIGTGFAEYLQSQLEDRDHENDILERKSQVYREALIRLGVDPDETLRKAGFIA